MSSKFSNLGDRMKGYEAVTDFVLMPRTPLVIRCDGKSFHSFTKKEKFKKPFDETFSTCMEKTLFNTAKELQGCVFGYTMSDELTFVLRNDQSLEANPWFGNRVQKLCSIAASSATRNFVLTLPYVNFPITFDARIFTLPSTDEVINNLIWRQRECVRNSINMASEYLLSDKLGRKTALKLLIGKKGKERQELMFQQCGKNWSTYPESFKNGIMCYKKEEKEGEVARKVFVTSSAFDFVTNREKLLDILNNIKIDALLTKL